jgi:hypothetical protein
MKTIPDPPPPRLSTFKRRGGSGIEDAPFRRPGSTRPDQRRLNNPALLSRSMFSQRGPLPCLVVFLPAFPLLPCVIHPPSLFGPRGPPFLSPSPHYLPRVPFSSHVSLPPKIESVVTHLSPFHLLSSAMRPPLSSFAHLVTPVTPS